MSGGVDSSVAAALLKKMGFKPIGIFLKFWQPENNDHFTNRCCSTEASFMARQVAQKIEIPFYVLDFREQFKKEVADYFISEYKKGHTPNPCVKCNQKIKFGLLLQKAREFGAEFIATGHYAQIFPLTNKSGSGKKIFNESAGLNFSNSEQTKPVLKSALEKYSRAKLILTEARDKTKDQSYFLWTLKPEQLQKILFPIGNFTKPEVRKLAKKWGLPSALSRESQEICFVNSSLWDFLQKYLKPKKGKIVDLNGKIIGEHFGALFYTIGQRHHLEIPADNPEQKPYYVARIDLAKNEVIVGHEADLYSKDLIANEINWIKSINNQQPAINNVEARIRYGHPKEKVKIKFQNSKIQATFDKPQRAITPGQSVVFYQNEAVLGGGIIENKK